MPAARAYYGCGVRIGLDAALMFSPFPDGRRNRLPYQYLVVSPAGSFFDLERSNA
jgi:hypothetical protein